LRDVVNQSIVLIGCSLVLTVALGCGTASNPKEDLLKTVGPAIVQVNSSPTTEFGLLIEGNYVVTAAHVVWPASHVTVIVSEGSNYPGTPVLGWDLLADIAVIGPVDTIAAPFELSNVADPQVGDAVFALGRTTVRGLKYPPDKLSQIGKII
jgi:S1-C subfamily serine protease